MRRYLRGGSSKAGAEAGPDEDALLGALEKQVAEATLQAFAGSSELPHGGPAERRALLLRYLRAGGCWGDELLGREPAAGASCTAPARTACDEPAAAAAWACLALSLLLHCPVHCVVHCPAEKLDVESAARRLERQAAWRRGWGDVTEVLTRCSAAQLQFCACNLCHPASKLPSCSHCMPAAEPLRAWLA